MYMLCICRMRYRSTATHHVSANAAASHTFFSTTRTFTALSTRDVTSTIVQNKCVPSTCLLNARRENHHHIRHVKTMMFQNPGNTRLTYCLDISKKSKMRPPYFCLDDEQSILVKLGAGDVIPYLNIVLLSCPDTSTPSSVI